MSYFVSQVASSINRCLHRTLTICIALEESCLISLDNMAIVSLMNAKWSSKSTKSYCSTQTHLTHNDIASKYEKLGLSLNMLEARVTPKKPPESFSNCLIYQGISFPHRLNLIILFKRNKYRNTPLPVSKQRWKHLQ